MLEKHCKLFNGQGRCPTESSITLALSKYLLMTDGLYSYIILVISSELNIIGCRGKYGQNFYRIILYCWFNIYNFD